MAENLTGIIERVTFHNPDTGFAVLRVQARGRRGLVTVVGQMPSAVVGEYIHASGEWIQDRVTHRARECTWHGIRSYNIGGDYHFKRLLWLDWPTGTVTPHRLSDLGSTIATFKRRKFM